MPTEELVEDPICKMKVAPSKAAASESVENENGIKTYYFCSSSCHKKFQAALAGSRKTELAHSGTADCCHSMHPKGSLSSTDAAGSETSHHGPGTQAHRSGVAQKGSGAHGSDLAHHGSDCAQQGSGSAQQGSGSAQQGSGSAQPGSGFLKSFYLSDTALAFTCPMHPEVVSKEFGSCPICGMALESFSAGSTGSDSAHSELDDSKQRFLIALIFTIALMLICAPSMLGFKSHSIPFSAEIQLLLSLPIIFYSGVPIYRKALDALKNGHLNMFTLITFGVSISFVSSLAFLVLAKFHIQATSAAHSDMLYFESAASIITLVLLGQILELKARQKCNSSLEGLFALAPQKARRIKDSGEIEEISVVDVKKADRLQILAGDKIPCDGMVQSGSSSADESLFSGNSLPVAKNEGDRVLAGTINGNGSLVVVAETLGRETVFAQVLNLLSQAQRSRSPMQELADQISAFFIPAVVLIAIATFAGWLILGGNDALKHAIKDSISVLVIACPCALGLATPIAVSVAVAKAAKSGLLVKDSRALEMLGQCKSLLMDKTGTLSKGIFEIVDISLQSGINFDEALLFAASLEQESRHPLAQSIYKAASDKGIELIGPEEVQSSAGRGLQGNLGSKTVSIGSARFLEEQGIAFDDLKPPEIPADVAASLVYMAIDGKCKAIFALSDKLKPESLLLVEGLKSLEVDAHILSGDGKESVRRTGKALKIPEENLYYNLLPADKVSKIKEMQESGQAIAMLGDGINDAAALQTANAGVAMASGSDIALSSAPITLMKNDLLTVLSGIKLGRLMSSKMKENLILAFAYNILALIFATGILYPSTGLELEPSMAAAAMSLSSLSVIINSMRLNNEKI